MNRLPHIWPPYLKAGWGTTGSLEASTNYLSMYKNWLHASLQSRFHFFSLINELFLLNPMWYDSDLDWEMDLKLKIVWKFDQLLIWVILVWGWIRLSLPLHGWPWLNCFKIMRQWIMLCDMQYNRNMLKMFLQSA